MSENSVVCADFPQTRKRKSYWLLSPAVVRHQLSVCRLNRWAPYLESVACVKVFEITGSHYAQSDFSTRSRSEFHIRPRKWIWWILRYHPGLNISWHVIGKRYKRDHSTILFNTKAFNDQLRGGYRGVDLDAMQSLCDALESEGMEALNVRRVVGR